MDALMFNYATKEYVQARIAEAMAYAGSGGGSTPVLITKNITANGVYNAADDNADGFSSVDVDVAGIVVSDISDAIVCESTGVYKIYKNPKASPLTNNSAITTLKIDDTTTVLDGLGNNCSYLKTMIGGNEVTELTANTFRDSSRLESAINFPKCTSLSGTAGGWFRGCTHLTDVTLGSVGYGLTIQTQVTTAFQSCTQNGLTITIYCTGAKVDDNLGKIRNGATNATIVVKASENTTYGGNSFAAGDTILTSTP